MCHLVVVVHVKDLHGLSSVLWRQEVGQILPSDVVPAGCLASEAALESGLGHAAISTVCMLVLCADGEVNTGSGDSLVPVDTPDMDAPSVHTHCCTAACPTAVQQPEQLSDQVAAVGGPRAAASHRSKWGFTFQKT